MLWGSTGNHSTTQHSMRTARCKWHSYTRSRVFCYQSKRYPHCCQGAPQVWTPSHLLTVATAVLTLLWALTHQHLSHLLEDMVLRVLLCRALLSGLLLMVLFHECYGRPAAQQGAQDVAAYCTCNV